MTEISAAMVAELRRRTGASMMDCKRALVEAGGDAGKAEELLRKRGVQVAAKKADRETNQGWIGSYIHGGRIGAIVEVACETDFVAKNEKFQAFIKDLAMHICATNPIAVRREEIAADFVEKEREIYLAQMQDKPANVRGKIVEGKLQKFFSEKCLLEQAWFKDQGSSPRTVQQVLTEQIATIGENIVVRRFARLELGRA